MIQDAGFWYTCDFDENNTCNMFRSFTQICPTTHNYEIKQLKNNSMKKLFYVLILAVMTSLTIVSCTEQQINPKSSGGGTASDPVVIK
jgi:hypothetical protein